MVCRNQELIRGVAKFGVLDLDLFPLPSDDMGDGYLYYVLFLYIKRGPSHALASLLSQIANSRE
jgi:hypothetical protein